MSRDKTSAAVGASSMGKVGLESAERTNVAVAGQGLPEQQPPCSHRNRVEDKPCDRCHRARPAGARPAGEVVASSPAVPAAGAAAMAATAAAAMAEAAATPVTAPPPLAEADKDGTKGMKAPTPPERDEIKSERQTGGVGDSGGGSSGGSGDADVGRDVSANGKDDADTNAKDDADATGDDDTIVSVGGGDGRSDEEEPTSHWACRSCSTFNTSSVLFCSSCSTPMERKGDRDGKADWWCCKQCSRFNNFYQDGDTCRLCSAPEGTGGEEEMQGQDEEEGMDDGIRDNDEEEEEMEDEMISVGGGELMSSMTMAAGRVERLAPPLPPA